MNNDIFRFGDGTDNIRVPLFKAGSGFIATTKSSAVMRKIRSNNTKAEVLLRRALWAEGCRYRLCSKKLIGKPDIIFVSKKIVVFVDGDFWHGYNWKEKKEKLKSNRVYWIPKIERNIQRDVEVTDTLLVSNWQVIRFWEHDIKQNLYKCADKVFTLM